jgi:hypothetical protein
MSASTVAHALASSARSVPRVGAIPSSVPTGPALISDQQRAGTASVRRPAYRLVGPSTGLIDGRQPLSAPRAATPTSGRQLASVSLPRPGRRCECPATAGSPCAGSMGTQAGNLLRWIRHYPAIDGLPLQATPIHFQRLKHGTEVIELSGESSKTTLCHTSASLVMGHHTLRQYPHREHISPTRSNHGRIPPLNAAVEMEHCSTTSKTRSTMSDQISPSAHGSILAASSAAIQFANLSPTPQSRTLLAQSDQYGSPISARQPSNGHHGTPKRSIRRCQ